jgi:lipopolysaccharide biosynthesis regulator YciM
MGDVMAQFCCEMADAALADEDRELARRHLRQARRHDPRCIRARFILARIVSQDGDIEQALGLYEEIAELDQDYIPELLEDYITAANSAGQADRARSKLDEWSKNYRGISLVLKLADFLGEEQGGDAAGRFLVETLTAKPSVRGLDRLVELKADGHLQAEASDEILKAVTERLMARQPAYRCMHCGFSGQTHHWQCPSCRHWSTTKKIPGVLGE